MTADKKFVIDEICKFSFLKPGHPVHVCIQSPPDKAVVWPYNCPHTPHCKGVRTKTYKKSPYDMVGEVSEGCLLITSPVWTSHLRPLSNVTIKAFFRVVHCRYHHLSEAATLFVPMDRVDIASFRTASISPVARVLYSLDYCGCHLVKRHD